MKRKHYFIIAIFCYLAFLISSIPANIATSTLNNNASINIKGVNGTIWNGGAQHISINNKVRLAETEWSFNLWKIFIGQIAAQVSTSHDNRKVEGEFGSSFLQRYFVNNLSAEISAEKVTELADIPLAQLAGDIIMNIEHAHWQEGTLPLAIGKITWNDASITIAETALLGLITINMSENNEGFLTAKITSKGGDILVDGNAGLLPEADYTTDIKLSPTSTASDNITKSLSMFASRQGDGAYLLKKTGQLNQLGLQ